MGCYLLRGNTVLEPTGQGVDLRREGKLRSWLPTYLTGCTIVHEWEREREREHMVEMQDMRYDCGVSVPYMEISI